MVIKDIEVVKNNSTTEVYGKPGWQRCRGFDFGDQTAIRQFQMMTVDFLIPSLKFHHLGYPGKL
ncbi:hypothetical protein RR48_14003 [Papilio machaon]|uniref:Uncharacterized protein n=1 Tax=Papilio machaon TaxID=76193 RepID=A0A194RHV8_PAPMA|nr:hypothetical protein RR48_14003 [Papilio machaon]